jgi:gp16 family phage-associated protein
MFSFENTIRIKLNSFALLRMNENNSMQPKTPAQVREEFTERGESVADFARRHKLLDSTVHQVLNGRQKGTRGESHRAAVLLGLKIGTLPTTSR